MGFYDERIYFDSLKWDDVFKNEDDFVDKIESIGGISDDNDLKHLYELLSMKYARSHTRYTDEFSFIMGIKRELNDVFPNYLIQKQLMEDAKNLDIDEIRKAQSHLRNIVEHPNDPTTDADTVAIKDLSTMQESLRITNNKLSAILAKYNAVAKEYTEAIYKKCNVLFRIILDTDTRWIY